MLFTTRIMISTTRNLVGVGFEGLSRTKQYRFDNYTIKCRLLYIYHVLMQFLYDILFIDAI